MEKLEYSRYYSRTIMNQFILVPKVDDRFIILMDLTKFLLSFVCWSFQVFVEIKMSKGIKSGKTLSLGMPKEPQGNIQGRPKHLSLGMPRMASPLLSTIHRYVTWSYIFIHHVIWVLLGASCFLFLLVCHNYCLLDTPFDRETHISHDLLECSMWCTYIFWAMQLLLCYLYS
jgi:hypothetical protein